LTGVVPQKRDVTNKSGNKNEEPKKETNNNETTITKPVGNQLYFVEQYSNDGQEIGKSDKFFINENGGYLTAILNTIDQIGVTAVDVRMERESLDGTEIIDTQSFNVSPDNTYFVFDKLTFYKSGDYRITVLDKNGNDIAVGKLRIEFN
jgi:hypothetical protein